MSPCKSHRNQDRYHHVKFLLLVLIYKLPWHIIILYVMTDVSQTKQTGEQKLPMLNTEAISSTLRI